MATETIDPVSSLITALAAKHPELAEASEQAQTDRLAEAAKLIPTRSATSVEDLLADERLARFRMHYAAGKVEAQLVSEALALLRAFLIARGLL